MRLFFTDVFSRFEVRLKLREKNLRSIRVNKYRYICKFIDNLSQAILQITYQTNGEDSYKSYTR